MFNRPKSSEELHLEQWKAMHRHEWLFPQNFEFKHKGEIIEGPTTSEEYLSEFARRERLFMFRCPKPYKFPLLEKYKEHVALSSHLMQGQMIIPYTVFQLNGSKLHIMVDWLWDTDKDRFVFPVTMFTTNQLEFIKFIDANEEHECEFKKDTLGFGARNE